MEFLQPQTPAFHSQWRMDCLLGCFVVLYTVSSAFAGLPFSMRSPCAWVFWSISNNHMCPLLQRPPGQLPVGHLLCSFLRLGVLGPHCTFGPKLTRREDLRCFILLWRLKKKNLLLMWRQICSLVISSGGGVCFSSSTLTLRFYESVSAPTPYLVPSPSLISESTWARQPLNCHAQSSLLPAPSHTSPTQE